MSAKQQSQSQQLKHAQAVSDLTVFPLSILANNIEIAGNVGSLFRIADALGVEKLYLTGTSQTPPRYKIRKAARSTENHIPYEYQPSALDVIATLKQQGYAIIALEITHKSQSIRAFKPQKNQPICLIIGAENEGVAEELLEQADQHIHIPMFGKNSSMNVATSCAIAVHELIHAL